MDQIKQLVEKYNLTGFARVFAISLTAGFLMVLLPGLGINRLLPELNKLNIFGSMEIANPMAKHKDPLENIYPRLELKVNTYSLQKEMPSVLAATAIASEDEYNQANAYAVIDFDSGKVIASKKLDEKVSIASLTKIMTAVIALDLSNPSDLFTISKNASEMIPTKIGVIEGEKMTLEELLNAAILTSANDAVQVIKEGVDEQYGNEIFIKSMNAKAKFLGLSHTSFENPQGFDGERHFGTAEDLGILTHYALTNYPLINELSKKEYAFLAKDNNHKQFDLYNWNGLLGVYPGASGVKIGNTGKAQKTTIVTAEREGKKIMVVLLGAPTVLARDMWAAELLDLGFEQEYGLKPVDVTEDQLREKYKTWTYWAE